MLDAQGLSSSGGCLYFACSARTVSVHPAGIVHTCASGSLSIPTSSHICLECNIIEISINIDKYRSFDERDSNWSGTSSLRKRAGSLCEADWGNFRPKLLPVERMRSGLLDFSLLSLAFFGPWFKHPQNFDRKSCCVFAPVIMFVCVIA